MIDSLVFPGQLIEPHVGVLGDQHEARHPVQIGTEALGLGHQVVAARRAKQSHGGALSLRAEDRDHRRAGAGEDRFLFLADEIEAAQHAIEILPQDDAPAPAHELQLAQQRIGRTQRRQTKKIDQVLIVGDPNAGCVAKNSSQPAMTSG